MSGALQDLAKISRSMGMHVTIEEEADSAIQLNREGGWGDDGETETKKRLRPAAVSQAAGVLKKTPQHGMRTESDNG